MNILNSLYLNIVWGLADILGSGERIQYLHQRHRLFNGTGVWTLIPEIVYDLFDHRLLNMLGVGKVYSLFFVDVSPANESAEERKNYPAFCADDLAAIYHFAFGHIKRPGAIHYHTIFENDLPANMIVGGRCFRLI